MLFKTLKNIHSLIRENLCNSWTVCLCNSRIFFFIFLFAVSCHKSPTSPDTGTLTGTVLLEGETDHSGIIVALYKLAELDTTILRYNREYPPARRLFGGNVDFPISQATEFACPVREKLSHRDHRLSKIVAEARTKQDGSFKKKGVQKGNYNPICNNEGLELEYVHEVTSG